jgi:hypothetical protein
MMKIVSEKTDYWVGKATDLQKQYDESVQWVLQNKELCDKFRSEVEMLTKDRGLTSYRYEASISDLIDRTRVLQTKLHQIYDFLWNFDSQMAESFVGLADIEDVIAVGRFGELSKRDNLLRDLD